LLANDSAPCEVCDSLARKLKQNKLKQSKLKQSKLKQNKLKQNKQNKIGLKQKQIKQKQCPSQCPAAFTLQCLAEFAMSSLT
jgi:hypothetical protein